MGSPTPASLVLRIRKSHHVGNSLCLDELVAVLELSEWLETLLCKNLMQTGFFGTEMCHERKNLPQQCIFVRQNCILTKFHAQQCIDGTHGERTLHYERALRTTAVVSASSNVSIPLETHCT